MSVPVRGCPQVKDFEKISSDGHQISLSRTGGPMSDVDGAGPDGVPCLMSRGRGLGLEPGGGALHCEVQCIMGNGHMVTSPPWTD